MNTVVAMRNLIIRSSSSTSSSSFGKVKKTVLLRSRTLTTRRRLSSLSSTKSLSSSPSPTSSSSGLIHDHYLLDKKEWGTTRRGRLKERKKSSAASIVPPPKPSTTTKTAMEVLVSIPSSNVQAVERAKPKPNTNTNKDIVGKKKPKTHATFAGDVVLPLTSDLFLNPPESTAPSYPWPVFRLMDEDGQIRSDVSPNSSLLSTNILFDNPVQALRAHRYMIRLIQMDDIFLNAQRQGRISFYMSCRGEEAIHIGSASSLTLKDVVLAQYREAGLLMYRGFTLNQFADQCFSNDRDLGRGRQMPIHYGSKALNYHTISSPLGTQIPQAVGVAYRLKFVNEQIKKQQEQNDDQEDGKMKDTNNKMACAICFFGDGAASTGDFHYACNFASTLETPVIFFCRNNGYAISTPIDEQYRGDGIIGRAPGYGMAGLRVDGNDIFAVSCAVQHAKKYAIEYNKPVLIEAMTYRQSHHSTSDDSTRYRTKHEIQRFQERSDPLLRFNKFLLQQNWLKDDEEDDVMRITDEERLAVLGAMEQAEVRSKPKLDTLFDDVYYEMPQHLKRQKSEHMDHIKKYREYYEEEKAGGVH